MMKLLPTSSNSPQIEFTTRFEGQFKKAPKHIKEAFIQQLELFRENPFSPTLNNHPLRKEFAQDRSIDVGDAKNNWRALYRSESKGKKEFAVFSRIGTHKQLYV